MGWEKENKEKGEITTKQYIWVLEVTVESAEVCVVTTS